MRRFVAGAWRILKGLPLAIVAPLFLAIAALGLLLADTFAFLRRQKLSADVGPATTAASVVIPNWNGRELLEEVPAHP